MARQRPAESEAALAHGLFGPLGLHASQLCGGGDAQDVQEVHQQHRGKEGTHLAASRLLLRGEVERHCSLEHVAEGLPAVLDIGTQLGLAREGADQGPAAGVARQAGAAGAGGPPAEDEVLVHEGLHHAPALGLPPLAAEGAVGGRQARDLAAVAVHDARGRAEDGAGLVGRQLRVLRHAGVAAVPMRLEELVKPRAHLVQPPDVVVAVVLLLRVHAHAVIQVADAEEGDDERRLTVDVRDVGSLCIEVCVQRTEVSEARLQHRLRPTDAHLQ
mmetsp:Transcript_69822/g.185569  ORF Transcript_69822/g.185569 Transcript_69822/m.185569 type:complete len:273 (+) Transcript_69822:136-954(+)